jgi:ABC-type nickel/cobalt efflux system permease component RcnA
MSKTKADPTTKSDPSKAKADPSTKALVDDLVQTTIAYLKQETLGQLSGLRKLAVMRLLAAICFAIGGVLLVIAAIRAMQTQTGTALSGNLSWLPYLFGVLIASAAAAVIAWLTIRTPRARAMPGSQSDQRANRLSDHDHDHDTLEPPAQQRSEPKKHGLAEHGAGPAAERHHSDSDQEQHQKETTDQ